MLHFTSLIARFRATSFFRIHSNIKERTKQNFKKGCMTLCPFFVFLKKEDHALLPVSFPCCEPTTFYTIYYPFHFLAASLRRFMAVQCEHSEAREREKRPCRDPIRFYAVLYIGFTMSRSMFTRGIVGKALASVSSEASLKS